jgi:hypothetical protein
VVTDTGNRLAVVWGSEPPAFSIGYGEPLGPQDSGFTVLFDDAPDPEDVDEVPPDRDALERAGITFVCLHCLLNDNPEIGRGLDIAREHGVADLDEDDEWVVGDLSRLDRD